MLIVDLDLKDGRGVVSVAVSNIVDRERLRQYFNETEKMLDKSSLNEDTNDRS